jgi:3-methylcrotonyl-CoA carboxylase alpha subunit
VEFIADQDGTFYFMEMNTRLQVEHPVTEMITGLDLVEWQLRVASGQPLPLAQEQLTIRGHALEARIYAEDPDKGFLPSTGKLVHLAPPAESINVRVDTGVEQDDEISPHYDPMIAKLIVWDDDRERALARMQQALASYRVVGVSNNTAFLSRLIACPAFANADLDTGLIEREQDFLFPAGTATPKEVWLAAAVAELLRENVLAGRAAANSGDPYSPWHQRDGWRVNSAARRELCFRLGETEQCVSVAYCGGNSFDLTLDGQTLRASGRLSGDQVLLDLAGRRLVTSVVVAGERRHVFLDGRAYPLSCVDPLHHTGEGGGAEGGLTAPMPGKVIALLAEVGSKVAAGAPLLILEAMKMEHTIAAPFAGTVNGFHYGVGDQVSDGAELVDFAKESA